MFDSVRQTAWTLRVQALALKDTHLQEWCPAETKMLFVFFSGQLSVGTAWSPVFRWTCRCFHAVDVPTKWLLGRRPSCIQCRRQKDSVFHRCFVSKTSCSSSYSSSSCSDWIADAFHIKCRLKVQHHFDGTSVQLLRNQDFSPGLAAQPSNVMLLMSLTFLKLKHTPNTTYNSFVPLSDVDLLSSHFSLSNYLGFDKKKLKSGSIYQRRQLCFYFVNSFLCLDVSN